jgi:uncharacterized membrane protein
MRAKISDRSCGRNVEFGRGAMNKAGISKAGMNGVRLVAAFVFTSALVPAPGARSQTPQQSQSATFELAMCNLSDFKGAFVALSHKQDAQKWLVNGWYAIPDNGCTFIGTFLRDTIYYYAQSNDGGVWRGSDTDQTSRAECIDPDKWFQVADGPTCSTGLAATKFRLITVPASAPRLTYTLTGKK